MTSKYPSVAWRDPIIPHASLAILLKAGTIDSDHMRRCVLRHPRIAPPTEVPPWRALWSWTDLPRTQYVEVVKRLRLQLAERTIVHPGELLHVIGEVLELRAFDDDLLDGEDARTYFGVYLDEVVDKGTLEPRVDLFSQLAGSHAGLTYKQEESPEFADLRNLVGEAVQKVQDARMQDRAPDLMEELREDRRNARKLGNHGQLKGSLQDIPILHHTDAKEFAQLFLDNSSRRRPSWTRS